MSKTYDFPASDHIEQPDKEAIIRAWLHLTTIETQESVSFARLLGDAFYNIFGSVISKENLAVKKRPTKTITVTYHVSFDCEVVVPNDVTPATVMDLEEIFDIDVPEGGAHNSVYCGDSFDIVGVYIDHEYFQVENGEVTDE